MLLRHPFQTLAVCLTRAALRRTTSCSHKHHDDTAYQCRSFGDNRGDYLNERSTFLFWSVCVSFLRRRGVPKPK